jgi:aspartyl protease family protein
MQSIKGYAIGGAIMLLAAAGLATAFDPGRAAPNTGRAEAPPRLSVAAAAPSPAGGPRIVALEADSRGHHKATILINGAAINTLVDTGASVIAFSAEDAARAGLKAGPQDRVAQFSTANGVISARVVRVPEVRLQGIVARDVEAAIMPKGALAGTLLGMSFLRKLQSFEMRGSTLVLRQ